MENRPNIKKVIILIIGVILLFVGFVSVWHYFHTGTITITTDDPNNTITLTKVGNSSTNPQPISGHSEVSVSVAFGRYIASVDGGSIATTQLVTLDAHKTLSYKINPIKPTGVEPITYTNTRDITADNNQLLYLNSTSGNLNKIDSANNISIIGSPLPLKKVMWADPTFGVGQASNGYLYVINNGSVSLLSVPFSYNGAVVSFDVTQDRQIYVSYGANIYRRDQNGNFKKIYTAKDSEVLLSAGTNHVAVAPTTFDREDSPGSEIAVVDSSGKATKNNISSIAPGRAGVFRWSPSGTYLVLPKEAQAYVYDSSLREISVLPSADNSVVGAVRWLNDNTLLYSTNDQLWSYDLNSQRAQLLANMPLGGTITGLVFNSDKSYIYLTTTDSSDNTAIRRVGLKGQKPADYIFQLQSILPKSTSQYSMSLVNFGKPPVILVTADEDSDNPISGQAAMSAAQSELSQDGFDTSKLQFRLNSQ